MMTALTGGCLCKAIRYEAIAEPLISGACHCRDCQYVSGGAPANVMVIPSAALSVTSGTPHAYWSISDKGNRVARYFCADCGTPLFGQSTAHLEFIAIKVGSLDDPSWFRPGGNLWASSAQPWNHLDPGLPKWDKDPD
jgi:hypothetical protein